MRMDDEFRDLRPLDPRQNRERWERMAAGIARAAAPELARRAAAPTPGLLALLSTWTRPAMSAAGGLAMAAAVLLLLGGQEARVEPSPEYALALGYPATVASWMEAGVTPSVEELMVSLEGENR